MSSKPTSALVQRVIRKFGPVIDLRKNPEILTEILRGLGIDLDLDGGAPGGAPKPPPPEPSPSPPGPSKAGSPVTNEEILRAVLKLSRDVATLGKQVTGR
ncbi:MAG: hypothetical protein QOI38_2645 [Sphingomonadales bacterium]|jgi:hypothetical protein|nr:hypothetical protein [Sphingomonadales bacterium]